MKLLQRTGETNDDRNTCYAFMFLACIEVKVDPFQIGMTTVLKRPLNQNKCIVTDHFWETNLNLLFMMKQRKKVLKSQVSLNNTHPWKMPLYRGSEKHQKYFYSPLKGVKHYEQLLNEKSLFFTLHFSILMILKHFLIHLKPKTKLQPYQGQQETCCCLSRVRILSLL